MLERLKAEKKTIIVVTHDERIMQLAKRTLELRNGKIVGVNE
jgi:ABC-type lipoprotein export system ATPase subunit